MNISKVYFSQHYTIGKLKYLSFLHSQEINP